MFTSCVSHVATFQATCFCWTCVHNCASPLPFTVLLRCKCCPTLLGGGEQYLFWCIRCTMCRGRQTSLLSDLPLAHRKVFGTFLCYTLLLYFLILCTVGVVAVAVFVSVVVIIIVIIIIVVVVVVGITACNDLCVFNVFFNVCYVKTTGAPRLHQVLLW